MMDDKLMFLIIIKTSMMWPSKNFLLYIRNIIKMKETEWINNLKKYVNPPTPLWGYIQHVQIITIYFQKRANGFNTSKV